MKQAAIIFISLVGGLLGLVSGIFIGYAVAIVFIYIFAFFVSSFDPLTMGFAINGIVSIVLSFFAFTYTYRALNRIFN